MVIGRADGDVAEAPVAGSTDAPYLGQHIGDRDVAAFVAVIDAADVGRLPRVMGGDAVAAVIQEADAVVIYYAIDREHEAGAEMVVTFGE